MTAWPSTCTASWARSLARPLRERANGDLHARDGIGRDFAGDEDAARLEQLEKIEPPRLDVDRLEREDVRPGAAVHQVEVEIEIAVQRQRRVAEALGQRRRRDLGERSARLMSLGKFPG